MTQHVAGKKIKGRGGIKSKAAQLYTPLYFSKNNFKASVVTPNLYLFVWNIIYFNA